jgi:hypothetical protein
MGADRIFLKSRYLEFSNRRKEGEAYKLTNKPFETTSTDLSTASGMKNIYFNISNFL